MNPTTTASKAIKARLQKAIAPIHIEALEERTLLSTWYVAPLGNNSTGDGSITKPWASVQYAVNKAAAGDTINLRAGTYNGAVTINKNNLTLQSYAGENAAIRTSPFDTSVVGTIVYGANVNGGKLLNLDISGGSYYTIKTGSTYDTGAASEYGTSNILIQGNKIHDSGRDVIKLTPGSRNIVIKGNEIYNSGRRDPSNAEGIDAVNAPYGVFQDNYVHDITTNGIYYKGGSVGTIIERNRVSNIAYSGIILGQDTDYTYFDRDTNPKLYESINGIVRNNIVTNVQGAGVIAWAAYNARIYNNTLIDVAKSMFGGIAIVGQEHWDDSGRSIFTPSANVSIANNVVWVNSSRPVIEIRSNGLTGTLSMSNNRYYQGTRTPQLWDARTGFAGSLSQWQSAKGTDSGSSVGNPGVSTSGVLSSTSPCINAGKTLAEVTDDYDRQARPAGGAYDIGADEYGGTVTPPPTGGGTTTPTTLSLPLTAVNTWSNASLANQTGEFTATFSAKPTQTNQDVIIGLSNGAADAWSDLAPIVRFNTGGTIDARNGGVYSARNTVRYTAGTTYQVKLVVHTASRTYDVYVTPQGGAQVLVGQGYAFRTEQAGCASLNNIAKYNEIGDASVTGITVGAATTTPTTPSTPTIGTGTGLTAQYFNNSDFTGLYATRTDAGVNFNWGTGAPISGMGADTFSARWTGYVQPLYSETYTFRTNSDDGVRLWVNGQLIIDNWTLHAPTTNTGTITLQSGQKYSIKLEYYEHTGGAVMQLGWSSASQTQQYIPKTQLYTA